MHANPAVPCSSVDGVQPPAAVRARLWIEARALFSRADASRYCWLWVHLDDHRVRAFRLDCSAFGRDDLIAPLLHAHGTDPGDPPAPDGPPMATQALPRAPVVPVPRWAYSWGHPLQQAVRDFAGTLDADVLRALGQLEVPGPYFGSVGNYNRLATLPEPVRTHRLQALARFPPLVAPLLLSAAAQPELFGQHRGDSFTSLPNEDDELAPTPGGSTAAVVDAMDRGRDLTGALAHYWRVDRALIRSPLLRHPWPSGHRRRTALRLVNAIPAHARPQHPDELLAPYSALVQLLGQPRSRQDIARLGRSFAAGWNPIWRGVIRPCDDTFLFMRNVRDFVRAALDQAELPPLQNLELGPERLALAWIARRGLVALLRASRHWHELPTVAVPAPVSDLPETIAPLLGVCALAEGQASELTCRAALIEEGETMHHCIGDCWGDCVLEGTRIWHLQTTAGESATAEFRLGHGAKQARFVLEQLLGPRNGAPSELMERLAAAIETRLNDESLSERRRALIEDIATVRERCIAASPRRNLRPLDRTLRRELAVVLDYCSRQPDWIIPANTVYRGPLAGFRHASGPQLLERLQADDLLRAVREPDNPHDPRAVRLDWQGHKLGYVPRAHNATIARLLDAGQALEVRIVTVAAGEQHWEPVEITVHQATP